MRFLLATMMIGALLTFGCERAESPSSESAAPAKREHVSNLPPLHPNNIVSIAAGSEDHTTLVAALQAANYVTAVSASGPLTVFAPTNAAFDKLPAGTVEGLLEPDKLSDLQEILKYHVTTSALSTFQDGQSLGMANGARATMHVDGDQISINDAKVIASIPASNGIVHVVDTVLLPPAK
jgi:uncharacterized surface protein with fasciclin (FAS1) repeats